MALFELKQDTGSGAAAPWAPPTFKDCVAADIDAAFFEENEHADRHTVDGKDVLIVLEDDDLREHSAHWEAGAKQNFDTGLLRPTRGGAGKRTARTPRSVTTA